MNPRSPKFHIHAHFVCALIVVMLVKTFCSAQITYDYYQNPSKIGSQSYKATAYFIKSFEFIMQWGAGDTDSAIFYMQKAIEEDSLYAIAYASLGHMIKYGGYKGTTVDRDSIASLAEKALKINPKCGDAHTLMSWVYEMQHENVKAIESCKNAIIAEPDHRETWLWLGVRYSDNPEQIDSAIWAFNKSIEVDPFFGQPHQKLGWIYIYNLPDYQKAAYHFRKMVYLYENIEPKDERMLVGYYGLGEALLHSGDADNAIDTLNLLLKKSETSSLLWIDKLKSMTYSALVRSHMAKAKSELNRFIAINLGRQDKNIEDIGIIISLIEEFDALSFQLKDYEVKDTLVKLQMPLFQKVFDNAKEDYQINQAINYKVYLLLDEKDYDAVNEELKKLLRMYHGKNEITSNICYAFALNYTLMDKPNDAIKYLKRSVKEGFNDFNRIRRELVKLKGNPKFKEILEMKKQ